MKSITVNQNNKQAASGEKLISYQFAGGVSSALTVCGVFITIMLFFNIIIATTQLIREPSAGSVLWLVLSIILFLFGLAGTVIAAIARIKICNRYSNRGFELYTDKIVFTRDLNGMEINQGNIGLRVVLSCLIPFYYIYWLWQLVKNTKILANDDSNFYGELPLLLFVPFYSYYWFFTRGELINREMKNRGFASASNGIAFLILSIFGLGIVALAIMQRDFNLIPADAIQREAREDSYSYADVRKMYINNRMFYVETKDETRVMALTSRDFRNHLSALLSHSAA